MNIPAFCIRRPAFTIVISLVLTIIGLISFMNLPVRWIPKISPPEITVSTSYPGASAKLVEENITKLIEETLSGVNGIESIMSTSRQGSSQISLTFKLGQNLDAAVEDVRSSVERVRDALPKDALTPTVVKADVNNMPILYVTFYDQHRSDREMSDYIDKYIVPSFQTIDGVGSVYMYGKRVSAMRISLDPARMAAANVTVEDVTQIVQSQNASIPSGQIRSKDVYYSVVTDTTLQTPEQFNDLIIRDNQNQIVRIKDIGDTKLEPENSDEAFRINGKSAIALAIIPQSNANPLEVEKNIQKVFAEMQRSLPKGMQADIAYNQADYIRASIHSVYESFIEAVIFVWLVILAFLCSFRATLIPVITIPVCLIATFSILSLFGFSVNTITLMAFVLAIGLVVDDAIVMVENISHHIENGLSVREAALKGSKEIIFPIIAMTLTLTAVYAPVAFTPGLLGVLFREFTFTLAGAVLISGIVALTLSPMMCAKFLSPENGTSRYREWLTDRMIKLQQAYQTMLVFVLEKRKYVAVGLLVIAVLGGALFHFIPAELAPAEDMNEIDIFVSAPRNASFQYTDNYAHQLESIYQSIPDIESYLSAVGMYSPSHSFQLLKIKPKNQRKLSVADIMQQITEKSSVLSGVRVNISIPPPALAEFAGSDEGDSVGMVIMTTNDYRKLQQASQSIMSQLKQLPQFAHVDNKLKWDSEQFQLNIDRNRAADLKVSVPNITNAISTLLAGKQMGKTNDANIILQMNQSGLSDPNVFQKLYTRNVDGNIIPLGNLVNVHESSAPEVFHRYERLRADTIYVTLAPKVNLSDAIKKLTAVAQTTLPDDMKFTFTGEAKSFLDSNGKTLFTFMLALVFIYLVLVAQFESFIDPLIILLTVPFAVVGSLIVLKIFGGTLNIYSNIGLITLIGLIAKHGILITEFANRLRMQGYSIEEAVINAALRRLRPILMTTSAMILGALPLAFASGAGAESRQQVGLVIAGGLLFGTFFSLIIVPVAYTYFASFRKISTSPQQDLENAVIL
ncbi:MAG: hypothetical protein ACD_46C00184G0009 [uncultured bacterium]|nr:MAG: hypothetical protein ACD_46C00184G0009 [uncultured bacterium]